MEEKLHLVQEHRNGHSLNICLRALSVSKGSWHYRMRNGSKRAEREARDEDLKPKVVTIIGENPAYGYRRIRPDLEAVAQEAVNPKRLRRLLNQWDLALQRVISRPKPSVVRKLLNQAKGHLNLVTGLDPSPLEVLSTDFTEIRFDQGRRKAHLIAMLDVGSEWVPGWALGPSANATLALECWERVKGTYARFGRDMAGVVVHQDQDPVFTGYDWLRALVLDAGVRISYSERGARDNPWIESFWSRFKGENASLVIEAQDLRDLRGLIDRQMQYYNHRRRHSTLNNRPPLEYLKSEGIGPRTLSGN